MSILSIGEILIDFTPVEGMKHSYTANPGGAPANVAVSVARNGIRSGFLGKLGNDDCRVMLNNDRTGKPTMIMDCFALLAMTEVVDRLLHKPEVSQPFVKRLVPVELFHKGVVFHAKAVTTPAVAGELAFNASGLQCVVKAE